RAWRRRGESALAFADAPAGRASRDGSDQARARPRRDPQSWRCARSGIEPRGGALGGFGVERRSSSSARRYAVTASISSRARRAASLPWSWAGSPIAREGLPNRAFAKREMRAVIRPKRFLWISMDALSNAPDGYRRLRPHEPPEDPRRRRRRGPRH